MPQFAFRHRVMPLPSTRHSLSVDLLQGAKLYWQQWYGLFLKRMLSARRDRLALVTQLLVPIALVLVALWARQATDAFPQEPALDISRYAVLPVQPLHRMVWLHTCRSGAPSSLHSARHEPGWCCLRAPKSVHQPLTARLL